MPFGNIDGVLNVAGPIDRLFGKDCVFGYHVPGKSSQRTFSAEGGELRRRKERGCTRFIAVRRSPDLVGDGRAVRLFQSQVFRITAQKRGAEHGVLIIEHDGREQPERDKGDDGKQDGESEAERSAFQSGCSETKSLSEGKTGGEKACRCFAFRRHIFCGRRREKALLCSVGGNAAGALEVKDVPLPSQENEFIAFADKMLYPLQRFGRDLFAAADKQGNRA